MTCDEENKGAIAAVAAALYDEMMAKQTTAGQTGDVYYRDLSIIAIQTYEKWRKEND